MISPRSSLHRPTTLGLGLIVSLLFGIAFISNWNTRRLVENQGRVVHTQERLATLEAVLARVTEAETGERGFLITGDADYLRSYERAVRRARDTLDQLSRLAVGDAVREERIAALKQRVQARFNELRDAIAAQRAGGFDAAKNAVSTNHGRSLMNEMRALVDEMQQQERDALAVRSAESQRSAQVTRAANLLGSLLGISMVGLAFLLFHRELAHRQRAAEALRRLAAIVESSDDGIVSKSMDGRIVSWNASAERIYGYAADEVIGKPIAMLCPPERVDEVQYHLERVASGEPIEHFETNRVRKDGRRIDVSLSISPIRDDAGKVIGASAITRDITERKLLQRQVLETAAREQQRIGQDLHDGIGQELTGLAMIAEQLTCELSQRGKKEAERAERLVVGLEQALAHVRHLSRDLIPLELDADGLIVALSELAANTSEIHSVVCAFECDEPAPSVSAPAAAHLYRLAQEAVTNALKHGRARQITIKLADDGRLTTLRIADDGCGFSPTKKTTGSGLRIMRYRTDLLRAKLQIGPAHPRGTQVICELPHPAEARPQTQPALAAGLASSTAARH